MCASMCACVFMNRFTTSHLLLSIASLYVHFLYLLSVSIFGSAFMLRTSGTATLAQLMAEFSELGRRSRGALALASYPAAGAGAGLQSGDADADADEGRLKRVLARYYEHGVGLSGKAADERNLQSLVGVLVGLVQASQVHCISDVSIFMSWSLIVCDVSSVN